MAEKLDKDWVTNGLLDFEYKKYLLLAFLQHARRNFEKVKLYPPLAELIDHYQHLQEFQALQSQSKESFRKEIKGIDFERFRLIYADVSADSESLNIVNEVISYSLPLIKDAIEEGTGIYEFLEAQLDFQVVGITPLYEDEGYLLLQSDLREMSIFRYVLSKIYSKREQYRSLQTEFIGRQKLSPSNTPEQIKLWLIRQFKELPQPATFCFRSELKIPIQETYLPLAKRLLLKQLSTRAA